MRREGDCNAVKRKFTPQDALGEYDSFAEFVAADAYPTIAETVGKFIFMLHATGNDADGQDDVLKGAASA